MKIQRISESPHRWPFQTLMDQFEVYKASFLQSDLGKLYQAIPWQELVNVFGITDKLKGPKSIFSPRGKIALMFLKHHAACSDRKMIDQLNGNLDYQYLAHFIREPALQGSAIFGYRSAIGWRTTKS